MNENYIVLHIVEVVDSFTMRSYLLGYCIVQPNSAFQMLKIVSVINKVISCKYKLYIHSQQKLLSIEMTIFYVRVNYV